MTREDYTKLKFQCPSVTFIGRQPSAWSYLICDVKDCVHATTTELIGSDSDHVVLSVPGQKKNC